MNETWTYCNYSLMPETPTVEGVALVLHLNQPWLDLRAAEQYWYFCEANSEIFCLNCERVADMVTRKLVKFRQKTGRRLSDKLLKEFIESTIEKMAPTSFLKSREEFRWLKMSN